MRTAPTSGAALCGLNVAMFTLPARDPGASARFYADACGTEIVIAAASHALLTFPDCAVMLYIERREQPSPVELTVQSGSHTAFFQTYDLWRARGVRLAEAPTHWPGLGQCFVALDPDGNRIRVVLPSGWEHGRGPAGMLEPAPRQR